MQLKNNQDFHKKLNHRLQLNRAVMWFLVLVFIPVVLVATIGIIWYIYHILDTGTGYEHLYILGSVLGFTIFPAMMLKLLTDGVESIFRKLETGIYGMYRTIEKNENTHDEIDTIIEGNVAILLFVKKVIHLRRISFLLDKKSRETLNQVSIEVPPRMLICLKTLHDTLTKKINEQQNILTEAKSSLLTNVQGTTEFNHISELQQARLDKQIEQFKELQRVLVKV